jgi:hypothetical protein
VWLLIGLSALAAASCDGVLGIREYTAGAANVEPEAGTRQVDATPGAACGAERIDAGWCGQDAGLYCDSTTSCATGVSTCPAGGNAPAGTACPGGVCLNGACNACVAGQACSPNVCETGTLSCTTGQAVCGSLNPANNTEACGASSICCGGACATCATTSNANLSCEGTQCVVDCTTGTLCPGIGCVDTTSDANACGSTCATCPSSNASPMCVNSICTLEYGFPTEFSTCNPAGVNDFPPNYLQGELVTIPQTIDATALGIIGLSGTSHAVMAIYTNTTPAKLVAQTAAGSVGPGNNQLPLTSITALDAGTSYWVLVDLDAAIYVCGNTTTATGLFTALTYGSPLPSSFTGSTNTAVQVNFYVVGNSP